MNTFAQQRRDARPVVTNHAYARSGGVPVRSSQSGGHHTKAITQMALEEMLNRSPNVRSQLMMQQSLNQRPQLVAQRARSQSLSGKQTMVQMKTERRDLSVHHIPSSPVVQRFPWDLSTGLAGMSAGAYYGSYLNTILPLGLGTVGGGIVGGVTGYLMPSLVRSMRYGRPWDEVNREGRNYKSGRSSQTLADQLASSSTAFRALRAKGDEAVQEEYGRNLSYRGFPKGEDQRHSAGYKEGNVFLDETNHPAMNVQNMVFETANAVQTSFFNRVIADYDDKSLAKKNLEHYGHLLGRDPSEIPMNLQVEYAEGSLAARRSLVQEWGEWNSLQLAKDTFAQIRGQFKGGTAKDYWDIGFGPLTEFENFEEYYKERGEDHRSSVQTGIERAEEKRKNF